MIVDHYHYWFSKDPPLTIPLVPWMLDMSVELINIEEMAPNNGVVDLTSVDDDLVDFLFYLC